MTTITTARTDADSSRTSPVTLTWALKRTAFAVCVFAIAVSGAALLMDAAIEPEPRIDIMPVSAQEVFRDFRPAL